MRRPLRGGLLWILVVGAVLIAAVAVFLSLRFCTREEILLPSWTAPTLAETRTRLAGKDFAAFADEAYTIHLLRHPQAITALGLAPELGVRDDRLDDYSDAYVRTTQAIEEEIYRRLREYDRETLTPDERVTYDACEALWSDLTAHEAPAVSLYPVSASDDSPHRLLYERLIATWRLTNEQDVVDYVACLHQADQQILQLRKRLLALRDGGRLPPAATLNQVLVEIAPFRITERWSRSEYLPEHIVAGHNPYFVALRERLLAMPEIGVAQRVAYLTEARTALEREVIPAYEKLHEALVAVLAEAPATQIGVDQYPGGRDVYAGLLRHYTESDLSPAAIHAAGQDAVLRLRKEIDAAEEEARIPHSRDLLGTPSGVAWDGGAASTEEVAAACRAEIDRAWVAVSDVLKLPSSAVEVLIGEGAGGYTPRSGDGARPALLVVPGEAPRSPAVAAFVHREIVPGRHVQVATAREFGAAAVRAWGGFPALEEGWPGYALGVAAEAGLYDGDPLANLERLKDRARSAALAVVDTGIHALGWDYDRAVDYYAAATQDGEDASQVAVKGCIGSPGRATASLIGERRLQALRDSVQQALGEAFRPSTFHAAVLGRGLLPLSIIERDVGEALTGSGRG
ncbi:MAG: DUF885 family protein [Candidatus Bipolaricaulia bacterium]